MADNPDATPQIRGVDGRHEASAEPALDSASIRALNALFRDFSSTLDLDRVLENVARGVKRHLDYDTFGVLLLDDLGQQLKFRLAVGYSDEVKHNWTFGLGQGIVGTVAQTQQMISVDDVSADGRYIAATPGLRSELAFPLVVKGRTIGVLDVGSRKPGCFTDANRQLLGFVADHLAGGIENARLYESVRHQARTLSLLHEISRELASILDTERLLSRVAKLVKRSIDYQMFSVMLWDDDAQLLKHTFSLRFDERLVHKGGFPLGHGVTGTAAALRRPMRVPNVHIDPHYTDCGHGVEVRSELAVPLVFKDRLVGVLDLESVEYNAFTEQHEQMLSTLASYVAVALENARLYEKVILDEKRLENDLYTAREIQKGLLPDAAPDVPGVEVGFAYQTARELGGDFYDFLPYGEGRLAFAVGDAAGKGAPAALLAALAIGILRGHVVEHPCPPANMLQEMNQHLGQPRLDNRFVAMVFGIFDRRDRSLTLANAGFTRPLLVRAGDVEELQVRGTPLGMFPGTTYDELRVPLESGDVVVLTSDGINESVDGNCEQFGSRRLRALLRDVARHPAQEIAHELLSSTRHYESGVDTDDRTIVVLKVQ